MKHRLSAALAATLLFVGGAANAAVISTNESLSDQGVAASIIAAPADVNDDAATNLAIQAFDEAQNTTLLTDIAFDTGFAQSGWRVDSHMIFLNSGPGGASTLIEHGFGNSEAATFTFDGRILGVMSDYKGVLETNTSDALGAAGTLYPDDPFKARGLEGDPLSGTSNDYYSFAGNTITVGMRVTEPGDWIRVVTVAAVPLPASVMFLGAGLGALGFASRRRRKKS